MKTWSCAITLLLALTPAMLMHPAAAADAPRVHTAEDLVAAARARITETDAQVLAEEQGLLIIDVREPYEYARGYVPGAVNIPRGLLEFRIAGLEAFSGMSEAERLSKPIAVYCRSGARAALAASALQEMGYTSVRSIRGGYIAWEEAGLPVVEPTGEEAE